MLVACTSPRCHLNLKLLKAPGPRGFQIRGKNQVRCSPSAHQPLLQLASEEGSKLQELGQPRQAPVGNRGMDRAHISSTPQTGQVGTFDAHRIRDHHEQTGRTRCLTKLSPKRAPDPIDQIFSRKIAQCPRWLLTRVRHRRLEPASTHLYKSYPGPDHATAQPVSQWVEIQDTLP